LYTRPMSGLHLITRRNNRQAAFSLIRALLLRSLAGYPPGALQLTVFDPVGMGQSVAPLLPLSQYDPELLGGK
jgi:S-DNA-T family DNA segregation ATPase FtsK/SpoIIIE